MHKRLMIAPFLSVIGVAMAACFNTESGASFDACTVATPDGGIDPSVVCDIGWSCNGDGSHYSLACQFGGGNYACTCFDEGVAVKNFSVSPFTCNSEGALPAATSGCGWSITLQ